MTTTILSPPGTISPGQPRRPDIQILSSFYHAGPIRRDVLVTLGLIALIGTEKAKAIYARQGGLRLSEMPSPAIKQVVRRLEQKIGLPCDLSKCSLRRQPPGGHYKLPWHQDYAAIDLAEGQRAMIAWLPLDPLDGTRPSLEIAPDEPPLTHHHDGRRFLTSDDDSDRDGAIVLADLSPGDVVLFGPYAPHRTWCSPGMTEERLSLDLRFFTAKPGALRLIWHAA